MCLSAVFNWWMMFEFYAFLNHFKFMRFYRVTCILRTFGFSNGNPEFSNYLKVHNLGNKLKNFQIIFMIHFSIGFVIVDFWKITLSGLVCFQ